MNVQIVPVHHDPARGQVAKSDKYIYVYKITLHLANNTKTVYTGIAAYLL